MSESTASRATFNLRNLTREVARTASHENPSQLAEQVAKSVPDEMLREALEQALVPFVRLILGEDRPRGPMQGMSLSPGQPATFGSGAGGPAPARSSASPPTPAVIRSPGEQPRYSGSRKGSEIRDAWQRTLTAQYSTADGLWKSLGDCTYDDLQYIAAGLDKKVEQYSRQARGFRGLAALLTDHEVQTLRELPAPVLMQALGAK